jgi:hypothetical protein
VAVEVVTYDVAEYLICDVALQARDRMKLAVIK